jgi:hypothetical protein
MADTPERRPGARGRPRLAPDDTTKPRSVRLNDARWSKLKRLGTAWLERAVDRARDPQTKG